MNKYTEAEIKILQEGGKRLSGILEFLGRECKSGVSAKYIDELAEQKVLEAGDIPVFKNYRPQGAAYPFPASICISVNDCVAHGIPTDNVVLKDGDVVSLDLGLRHSGLVVDHAITIIVGENKKENEDKFDLEKKLLECTKKALEVGIEKCVVGNRVNDIGIAIEKFVKMYNFDNATNFSVVDVLCGHAVGREIHAEPQIPHADFGPGGEKIKEGMVLAIEPHISMGDGEIKLSKKDSWSYYTVDGHKTAQFEHTILVTKSTPVILTDK